MTLKEHSWVTVSGHVTVASVVCHSADGITCLPGAELDCPGGMAGPDTSAFVPIVLPATGNARVRYGNLVVESAATLRVDSVFCNARAARGAPSSRPRRILCYVSQFCEGWLRVRGDVSIDLERGDTARIAQAAIYDGGSLAILAGSVDFRYGIVCGRGSLGVTCAPGAEFRMPSLSCSAGFGLEADGSGLEADGRSGPGQDALLVYPRKDELRGGGLFNRGAQWSTTQRGGGGGGGAEGAEGAEGPRDGAEVFGRLSACAPAFVPGRFTGHAGCQEGSPGSAPGFEQGRGDDAREEHDVEALTVTHLEDSLAQSEEDHVRACALWARSLCARMNKHLSHCSMRRELKAYAPGTEPAVCAVAALAVLEEEIRELDATVEYYRGVREHAHEEMIMDESILAAVTS